MCRRHELRRTKLASIPPMLLAVAALATTVHAESLPYKARVIVPAAPIQSGPSDAFYPTDTLPEGAAVEVYREEADGWCAIRPPDNSFSWIYARHLKKLDDSLAKINKDDVASRIGSRLTEKRNAVQVRLKRDEVVQIIGGETVAGQTWYKIAPPAGEFRWIHNSCIERTEPASKLAAPENAILTVSATVDAADSNQVADAATAESPISESAAAEDEWRTSTDPAAANRYSTTPAASTPTTEPSADSTFQDANAQPLVTSGAQDPGSSTVSPSTSTPTSAAPTPPPTASALPAGDLERQLAEVELRLSRAVIGPPTSWNIEDLQRQAERLLTSAQTLAERKNVKATLAKLDRFASIERRYTNAPANAITPISSTPSVAPPSGLVPLVPNSGAATAQTGSSGAASNGAPYDAVGILRPVVSKRPGAPQFALVDERGQVLSFVSATPDVNLQPYIGRRVGVAGNRGYIPEFQRAHITAGRVAPLTDRMVR